MSALESFLTQRYSYENFKAFCIETFGEDIGVRLDETQGYKPGNMIIQSYAQICENVPLEGKELSIYAFKTQSINAKITLHKEIAQILKNDSADAVLAAFYDDQSTEFRLSLISKGFDYETNKLTFSSPRRQSFVLGQEAKTKTAKKQLSAFIKNSKSFDSLKNAFSLEVLNKDFYIEIKSIFDKFRNIKAPLSKQEKKEFSIKLISRILFLRFLKELGIVPSECFDLRENYYEKVLEPLFFEVLNTPLQLRKSDIKDNNFFATIPYLNGGLFAPSKIDCYQSNELKIQDGLFKDFFEILDSYHFTTDESTPDSQDIGLDPEMLGMVFENLLAEIDPNIDNNTNIRKSTGSFYTPRDIVSFMCKSTLLESLKTKLEDSDNLHQNLKMLILDGKKDSNLDKQKQKIIETLSSIKVLDLFCGSGAFPMGILHEIIHIQELLGSEGNLYERKLNIIQNQIYGVDIQPAATEIARLRCFLSLIIEVDTTKAILPLPNLDFKFVNANSLLYLQVKDHLSPDYKAVLQNLKEITMQYFNATQDKKQELQTEFYALRDSVRYNDWLTSEQRDIIDKLDPFDEMCVAGFFDSEIMFGLKDFDICISNPPYISTKGKSLQQYKDQLKAQYGFYDDAYNHAFFASHRYLCNGGILCLITPKTFWTISSKANLRSFLLDNTLIYLCDSANPFLSAMVDTCITQIKNSPPSLAHQPLFIDARDFENKKLVSFEQTLYEEAQSQVFFNPTEYNLKIYGKYNAKVKALMIRWWDRISDSKKISKYASDLSQYRASLKPGDVTLLGLITDGGQGLATANNGKYVGVREGSKEAIYTQGQRAEKLYKAKEVWQSLGLEFDNKKDAQVFLDSLSEQEVREVFDEAKEKFGRDVFGQGFIYRIVADSEIADVQSLSQNEKENGVASGASFVPYDKGDKDGNRWYLPTPYYINWSKENVGFLKNDPKARWQGYSFYFKEGFCWNNVLHYEDGQLIKCRVKAQTINDVASMSLYADYGVVSSEYLVALLNSKFMYDYLKTFINASVNLQINDFRQIPIIIPTQEQIQSFEAITKRACAIQKDRANNMFSQSQAEHDLYRIQVELNDMVLALYKL